MAGKQVKTGIKQGQPLSGIALIPYYIYSDGKTATILAELLNQKSDFT